MRTSAYAITAVLLLLAAVGCDTTTGSGTGQGQDGLAVVSLAIAGTTGGRSVLPAHAELQDVAAWRLLGGKTGETRKPLTALFSDPNNQTLLLATGDWDFTLEGYADEFGETLILGETIKGRRITLEGPNTLSFVVEPVEEGTGSIEIVINLPAGHGITQVKVFKDGTDLESPIEPEGNNVVFKQAGHEAGDYYYSFRLFKGDDLYGVVSELVQVRMNLSSKAAFELKQEDLNLSYVIEYHLNDGKFKEDASVAYYYRRTDAALVLPELDRKGYEFDGWHDNDGLGGEPVAKLPTPVAGGNRDFYAKWEPIPYDIKYELGAGGSDNGGNPPSYTIESPEITLLDPTPNGSFRFLYWYVEGSPESAVTKIPAGSTGHKTFYAQWIPQGAITFKTYDGSEDESFTYDVGTPVDRPEDPTWGQSQFNGWFNEEGIEYTVWPYIITGDVTMHAQWKHPVIFHPEGGSPPPELQYVPGGGAVEEPALMTKLPASPGLYTAPVAFGGWYNNPTHEEPAYAFGSSVAEPLDLYARWTEPPELSSGQTGDHILAQALAYIENDASGATNYTIVLDGNYEMAGVTSANINKANAVVTLVGKGPTEISLSSNGSLFRISAGELVLGNNITLIGKTSNTDSLVIVEGATTTLTMKEGATIKDNKYSINSGGGVYVDKGTFNMSGGTISGNSSSSGGGGVYVNGSTFKMSGGTISGNYSPSGGGVGVYKGTFNMSGGIISDNYATYGGGVYVAHEGGNVNKTGPSVIYGDTNASHTAGSTENTATSGWGGHAVYVSGFGQRNSDLLSGVNISTSVDIGWDH